MASVFRDGLVNGNHGDSDVNVSLISVDGRINVPLIIHIKA